MAQQLQIELRRIADGAGRGADDARMALGDGPVLQRLTASIRALAAHRGRDSSTCPSDAARAVGADNWRDLMPDARSLARELAKSGEVEITQAGTVVDPDADWHGPVRIRIADRAT